MNQLHFIQRIFVLRLFYHSFFCCNENVFWCLWLLGSLYEAILLLCAHTQSCARWLRLARPWLLYHKYTYRLIVSLCACFWKEGVRLSLLLTLKILCLSIFCHFDNSGPWTWFIGSHDYSQQSQLQMKLTDNVQTERGSLESNVDNRHWLMNALIMVSLHISWLHQQQHPPGCFATGGC